MYKDVQKDELETGIRLWKNDKNKFTVLMLHYSADPKKDPAREGAKWLDNEKEGFSEAKWNKEYEIDFTTKAGKLIFGAQFCDFDKNVHLIKSFELPEPIELLLSLDFGQRNPTAALVGAWTTDNRLYIIDEYYKPGVPSRTSGEMIKKFDYLLPGIEETESYSQKRRIIDVAFDIKVIDPTTSSKNRAKVIEGEEIEYSVKEEFYDRGFDFSLGANNVDSSITRIREYMNIDASGKPRLYIFQDKCPNLCWELQNYRYKELTEATKRIKNKPEEPVKKDDHCLVGDTMVTMFDYKTKQLKDIKIGEYVRTQKGINKVLLSRLTRKNADIYEIELSNGYKLKGTSDHKIYTNRGKIAIDTLRYDDIIEVLNINQKPLWKKQSSLIIKDIIGTVNIIALLADIKTAEKDYIKQSGNTIMVKYQKDFIYTTRTEILRTINFLILNLSKLKNIYQNILKVIGNQKSLEKKLERILIILDTLQKNGTPLKKVLSGTVSMEKNLGLIEKRLVKYAKYVERNIKHISLQEADFAIRIVKRERCGKEDVYNLMIENEHNYYANGILVKNCVDALRYMIMTRPYPIFVKKAPLTRIQKDIQSLINKKSLVPTWDIDS